MRIFLALFPAVAEKGCVQVVARHRPIRQECRVERARVELHRRLRLRFRLDIIQVLEQPVRQRTERGLTFVFAHVNLHLSR